MGQLFISYRHTQLETVRELERLLTQAGIVSVRDENEIRTFESITQTVNTLLAGSHAMLVVLSNNYPESRFCQWELAAAFIAAQQQGGKPCERIFVLNLGTGEEVWAHLPIELKDAKHATRLEEAVTAVKERLPCLQGTFGNKGMQLHTLCYGRPLYGSPRFAGRESDLWQLHSFLQGAKNTMVTGHVGPDLAVVSGLGGIGKTLLAEEYALRFSAAYPGGIFWLDAYGSFNPQAPDIEAFRQACVEQFHKVAGACGLSPAQDATIDQLRGLLARAIEAKGQRCLWVVDDIPTGLGKYLNEIKQWFSPCPGLAPTLVTTRSREYNTIGNELPLDVLDHGAALKLLKNNRVAVDGQAADADLLIERLGRHALALDIAGASIMRCNVTIAAYLATLDEGMAQLLEVPDEIVAALPTGCEKNIVMSLLHSIAKLSEPGLDFLRMAANLAPAPISKWFVELVFRHADGLEENACRERTERALLGCDNYSLARSYERFWSVHALVAATMKNLGETCGERSAQLRTTAMGVLGGILRRDIKDSSHAETLFVAPEVEHARYLTQRITSNEERALIHSLGFFDYFRGNPRQAVRDWQRIVAYDTQSLGADHPDTLTSMNNLATTLCNIGDHAGAKKLEEHVLACCKEFLGADHPKTLTTMTNMALTLWEMGDHAGSKQLLEHVLERRKELLGPDHPDTLTSMNNLAAKLRNTGDHAESKQLLEYVLARSKELLGLDHPKTLTTMSNLASTLNAMENHAGAKQLIEHVLARRRELLGPDHPKTTAAAWNLFNTLDAMGDNAAAQAVIDEHLRWLLADELEQHSADQRQIRDMLMKVVGVGRQETAAGEAT